MSPKPPNVSPDELVPSQPITPPSLFQLASLFNSVGEIYFKDDTSRIAFVEGVKKLIDKHSIIDAAMAESIQTIAEGSMSPKIAVKSRYALVEAGQLPETQYYTLFVDVTGINIV